MSKGQREKGAQDARQQLFDSRRGAWCADGLVQATSDRCDQGIDLLAVLAAWGQPGGPADVNHDGIVGTPDLLTVLGDWGEIENDYLLEIVSRDG